MKQLTKIRWCLGLNVGLLVVVVGSILSFATSGTYFRAGPHADFVLISVAIDSPIRYAGLLVLIACINCIKVIVAELGEPVLVFNVYNPDKRVITEFTRGQLLFYANAMFLVSNTRRVFEVMITVTQFDIALFSIIIEQMASFCTVFMLVKEKRFDARGSLTTGEEEMASA